MLHVTFRLSHVTCYNMWNACVDPWDMLNNFCFHVYAQKWVFVIMSHVTCHISHVRCHMSHCACHMPYMKCLCWFLRHAEQLLFWCLCSKVSICNYLTCHMLHVTCHMSYVKCLCWSLGHAEIFFFISMLKCCCLRVKMSMLFLTSPSPVTEPIMELVPSS